MSRLLVLVALTSLVAAPAALAAYPSTYAVQGSPGVFSPNGAVRFVAAGVGAGTRLSAVDDRSGSMLRKTTIRGAFGIPTMIAHDLALGMFRDGHAFVLQSMSDHPATTFDVVDTADLAVRERITLHGAWSFDALSPDGTTLYLIRHRSAQDLQDYVVRAYDLHTHALRPGRIADKSQRGWRMTGWPIARAVTADGRWVYTLYTNPGGFPFVHALDTVAGVAHCVGFAWSGDQGPLIQFGLALHGRRLLVERGDGTVYRAIDRSTWVVSLR
jgi:hypothetical protein